MTGRMGPRIALISAIVTAAVGAVGLIMSLVLNVFLFDDFDAHGEVPIPGSGRLHLPAGEVTISFHTLVTGGTNGSFPIPPLQIGITPPEGVADPVLTESMGSTTSVNSDVRARVWVAQVAEAGVYDIETGGEVNGYINPRLAFGSDNSPAWLPWASGGLLVAGIAELAVAVTWRRRAARGPQPPRAPVSLDEPSWPGPLPPPVASYQPTDQGVRLEQLKTLAALRDSGALSHGEFEAEKRRVLDS
jgi:hypothetical protein